MSNSKTSRFTHIVVLADGWKVPCNGLADAEATLARFAARGVSGKVVLVQG
jgi:hypothetical protein